MIEFLASELFKNAMLNLFMTIGVFTVFLAFIAMFLLIIGFIKTVYFDK